MKSTYILDFNLLHLYVCETCNKKIMKKTIVYILLVFLAGGCFAQNGKKFKGTLYNKEYNILMHIDFYSNSITIPHQPVFGEIPGYLEYEKDSRVWIISSVKLVNNEKARLDIVNDYGSEDLKATLSVGKNDEYKLKQEGGSRIKIAVNRKWVKIPVELKFIKMDE